MDVSLDSNVLDQLNTTEARALHDISDSLSACGVGKIVSLPQIIVVGEQSSGKSSVLEAISHVRFPVDGALCTRFATELVLRQAQKTHIDVNIKFADSSKPSRCFQKSGFKEGDLPEIIKKAKEYMGLSSSGKGFSKDILRLEIEGPDMYPLTLVDLPGIFQSDTETQSLDGKKIVDQLVESYMKQRNSIILLVITANNQLANHIALRKVKEFDPSAERTLGVITKPDLAPPGYAEERMYIRVAKNQEGANKLKLGWHVLRNRAEHETSLDARDELEDRFFQTGAWATIRREDRGIANLRKKLSRVLYDHVRHSLPRVIEDIEGKLREREEELDRLGKSRSSPEDKRSFLLTVAGDFQRLARDGIYGRYNDIFFGNLDSKDRKFRALLRNFSRAFDHILSTKGSKQVIVADIWLSRRQDNAPEYLKRFFEEFPYEFGDPEVISKAELDSRLQMQASANQGLEFPGSPNKDLAIKLFQEQAAPWKKIAEFHIDRVTTVAKAFVDEIFGYIMGPPDTNRTTEAILSTCVDPFFREKEVLLQEKLKELLCPYTEGYALPLDADFHGTLSRMSIDRLAERFCNNILKKQPDLFESKRRLSRTMIIEAISGDEALHGGEFGTDKVIDMMLAYYEMSRRTFTDNIINLAIESCLVCDIPDILTPTKVAGMTNDRLEELAAESEDAQLRRANIDEEVKILRQGLAQCRRYRPRAVTALPSASSPLASKNYSKAALPMTNNAVAEPASGTVTASSERPAPPPDEKNTIFGTPTPSKERAPKPSTPFFPYPPSVSPHGPPLFPSGGPSGLSTSSNGSLAGFVTPRSEESSRSSGFGSSAPTASMPTSQADKSNRSFFATSATTTPAAKADKTSRSLFGTPVKATATPAAQSSIFANIGNSSNSGGSGSSSTSSLFAKKATDYSTSG